jgi:hypothetical protein
METYKKGSQGDVVKEIQTLLNKFGNQLVVDGDFGNATLAAVTKFQQQNGLTATGQVDPITLDVLRRTKNLSLGSVALQYVGQTEKPGNQGFNNEAFENKMEAVGFEKGHAWCSYFAELCAKEAMPEKFAEFDKLFSASAVQTFFNFQKAGYKITSYPVKDSVVVWQNYKSGKPQWNGHVGICTEVIDKESFKSVEGNTNDEGSREGYIVAKKSRKLGVKTNGLNVLGFVSLK